MPPLADLPRTKIVVTLGPASREEVVIERLIEAGASVLRLNFSHGTHAEHATALQRIRQVSHRLGRPVAVLLDLSGPKFRVGKTPPEGIPCRDGETLFVADHPVPATEGRIGINYPQLTRDLAPGSRILIDDGRIRLVVERVTPEGVLCRVSTGGVITTGKGVNLPGVAVSAPALTDKDLVDLEWGIEHQVDYIALSFVRSVEDVRHLQRILHARKADIPVIAKIEKPEALEHIEAIIDAADGLMVARGDLGVEMSLERVPLIQKDLISRCHTARKPVIVATQMLESMTTNPTPTRAEVSDVANAILDGADAIMLSGETAVGRYPVNACLMMARIARVTESFLLGRVGATRAGQFHHPGRPGEYPTAEAVCDGAARIARDLGAALVTVSTRSGTTALLISKHRLPVPVLALSDDPRAVSRMCLYWGVVPLLVEEAHQQDLLLEAAERFAVEERLAKRGEPLLLVGGTRLGRTGATDMLRVHHIRAEAAASEPQQPTLHIVRTPLATHSINRDLCIQCGVCVQHCPVEVYRLGKEGVEVDPAAAEKCLFDYICRDSCPVGAISIERSGGTEAH